MRDEIHRAAYAFQLEVERGERTVVGVNAFTEEGPPPAIQQPDYPALEEAQKRQVGHWKTERDQGDVRSCLEGVRSAARSEDNLLPPIIEAVKSRATLGEISDVLREEWGTYDEG